MIRDCGGVPHGDAGSGGVPQLGGSIYDGASGERTFQTHRMDQPVSIKGQFKPERGVIRVNPGPGNPERCGASRDLGPLLFFRDGYFSASSSTNPVAPHGANSVPGRSANGRPCPVVCFLGEDRVAET